MGQQPGHLFSSSIPLLIYFSTYPEINVIETLSAHKLKVNRVQSIVSKCLEIYLEITQFHTMKRCTQIQAFMQHIVILIPHNPTKYQLRLEITQFHTVQTCTQVQAIMQSFLFPTILEDAQAVSQHQAVLTILIFCWKL